MRTRAKTIPKKLVFASSFEAMNNRPSPPAGYAWGWLIEYRDGVRITKLKLIPIGVKPDE